MRLAASVAPSAAVQEVVACGIVDAVCGHGAPADLPAEGIGERLAGPAEPGRVIRAAGEDDLDVGARIRPR